MTDAPHTPVMLDEVLAALQPAEGRTMVDGTFGAGGYSRALLDAGANVIAFDRDPTTRRFAAPLEASGRFELIEAPFSRMNARLGDAAADGVALDLGVSSMQMDEADRGFSLMRDGPLDMRMGADGPTAADLVNEAEPSELSRIFKVYGEEKQFRRVAGYIVRRRTERPFTRTLDLAEVVENALGGRRGARIHPATRVFQALRIAVNEELTELERGLVAAERTLKAGGRLAVVSFHSLEDRIVKAFLVERAGRLGEGSRHAPPRVSEQAPSFEIARVGANGPSDEEIARNPRARSARFRAATRTAAPAWRSAA
jgi:16S rRNA (cytosine1402-N4)-methyltransferase